MIQRVYSATVPSFSTNSSGVDLGKPYGMVYLEIPTMTSNSALSVLASSDGTTYRKINLPTNSSTVQFASFTVGSAITGVMVQIPAGFQYYQIITTATLSFSAAYKLVCYDI